MILNDQEGTADQHYLFQSLKHTVSDHCVVNKRKNPTHVLLIPDSEEMQNQFFIQLTCLHRLAVQQDHMACKLCLMGSHLLLKKKITDFILDYTVSPYIH